MFSRIRFRFRLTRTVIALAACPALARAQRQTLTVSTASGPVTGIVSAGVAVFKGIPYAAPPVDSLRWRAPRAAKPWAQSLAADGYGPSCMQPLPIRGAPAGSRASTVSENCLTLNVWTPAARTHALPVMVWIHGGGNVDGTSGRTLYDGATFARDSVVLVSFNYRLGVFGFFAHPAITARAGAEMTANFGLLDQLAALRWVRRNIAAFGGDTTDVTIFGESAGGQDVLALLTAPAARGLMQRAIAESPGGGWGDPPTLAAAEQQGGDIATRFGLPGGDATAKQLLDLPADTLMRLDDASPGPIIDGKLLRKPPRRAFADGHATDVPLIIGTNSDEGSLMGNGTPAADIFPSRLNAAALQSLRALYGAPATNDADFARLLFRDGYFAGPVRWIAEHAATGAPVYLYRFDYVVVPIRSARPGASHGSELPFIFENWPIPLMIPADQTMQNALHTCWIAFARTGSPDCSGLPQWAPYRPSDGRLMLINDEPAVRANPVAAVLDSLQVHLQP